MTEPLTTWSELERELRSIAYRLRQASTCPGIELTGAQSAECRLLARRLDSVRLFAAQCIEKERKQKRSRRNDDPLRWLRRNPIHPQQSPRDEMQHV